MLNKSIVTCSNAVNTKLTRVLHVHHIINISNKLCLITSKTISYSKHKEQYNF